MVTSPCVCRELSASAGRNYLMAPTPDWPELCSTVNKQNLTSTPLRHSLLGSYVVHFLQGRMLCTRLLQRSCASAVVLSAQDF